MLVKFYRINPRLIPEDNTISIMRSLCVLTCHFELQPLMTGTEIVSEMLAANPVFSRHIHSRRLQLRPVAMTTPNPLCRNSLPLDSGTFRHPTGLVDPAPDLLLTKFSNARESNPGPLDL
jgi:hypothetical protein